MSSIPFYAVDTSRRAMGCRRPQTRASPSRKTGQFLVVANVTSLVQFLWYYRVSRVNPQNVLDIFLIRTEVKSGQFLLCMCAHALQLGAI